MDLIKPKEITVSDGDGEPVTVTISKFPAVEGFEINLMYPTSLAISAIPKLGGDYKIPEELLQRIFGYVAVVKDGQAPLRLTTRALINNHCGDWEAILRILGEIMMYNNSFFRNGTISIFFAEIVHIFAAKISEILVQSSEQLSPTTKPPSGS